MGNTLVSYSQGDSQLVDRLKWIVIAVALVCGFGSITLSL